MRMIKVQAAQDIRVPKEGVSRSLIGVEPVLVPDSVYYRRRIADGDLLLIREKKQTNGSQAKKGEK